MRNKNNLVVVNNTSESLRDVLLEEFPGCVFDEEIYAVQINDKIYDVCPCNVINQIRSDLTYYRLA